MAKPHQTGPDPTPEGYPPQRVEGLGTPAPDFPPGLDWLNAAGPLTIRHLIGKVVLLDFWTYG